MTVSVPAQPKIYHIMHVDKLLSVITDGYLWCDAEVVSRESPGTSIGMSDIKRRRREDSTLTSHPGLYVGRCVPFYFCPRSVMLYLISMANHHELKYKGGQGSIIHMESDLLQSVDWANENRRRWAFTLSNAGSSYFEDRCDINKLNEIDWDAVRARKWSGNNLSHSVKDRKQAEFLMEDSFPWHLIERIGVHSQTIYTQVANILTSGEHRPGVEIVQDWYY